MPWSHLFILVSQMLICVYGNDAPAWSNGWDFASHDGSTDSNPAAGVTS